MISLNYELGFGWVLDRYYERCLTEFSGPLCGAEFGVAYGGCVERAAQLWRGRGTVWGFDTFEGHPEFVAQGQLPPGDNEATTMRPYYAKVKRLEQLAVDWQRAELARLGLSNAVLVPGLLHADSCRDAGITTLHYAHLDLDILESMQIAYTNMLPCLVPGGYAILHDCYQFPRLRDWLRQEIIPSGLWSVDLDNPDTLYCVLKKL